MLRHLHVIARATNLLASTAKKSTKILPSDEEEEEEDKEDDEEMDDAEKGEKAKEKKSKGAWDKGAAQELVARAHLTRLSPNDPTFLLLLTYISSTNIPKSHFQVMEIFRVGEEEEEEEAKANDNKSSKDDDTNKKDGKDEEKLLLWSGGPNCAALDVLANGWNCKNGGTLVFFFFFLLFSLSFCLYLIPLFFRLSFHLLNSSFFI